MGPRASFAADDLPTFGSEVVVVEQTGRDVSPQYNAFMEPALRGRRQSPNAASIRAARERQARFRERQALSLSAAKARLSEKCFNRWTARDDWRERRWA